MLIVFISITGKIASFLKKTGHEPCLQINTGKEVVTQPFFLICGSIGFGEPAPQLLAFLENNHHYLKGIIGSGNKNWGSLYGKAPRDVAEKYGVPLLFLFESAGNSHDLAKFEEVIQLKNI